MRANERLKELRESLGITVRDVEDFSRRICEAEQNDEYYIANSWLAALEKQEALPSMYKLFTLSVIYRTKYTELLLLYGLDLDKITKYQKDCPLAKTHLAPTTVYDQDRRVSFPVRFDPAFRLDKTSLLSRMVEMWGEVPIGVIQHLDLRRSTWGLIGLDDYTLHPLLPPGSFVQIDERQTRVFRLPWRSEHERPIYFIELRDGYACSWCEMQGGQLLVVPHPLSPCTVRAFATPREAQVVGRVTGVAMRMVSPNPPPSTDTARLPTRS